MRKPVLLAFAFILAFSSCRKDVPAGDDQGQITLTIFSINDQHGQINNFSKIKHIVDAARMQEDNVLLVCAGDMFSGNAVVDFIDEKGLPMIDLMNRCAFDVSVIGNHEFDYGQDVLVSRIEQAEFDFICANVDMTATSVPQPEPYVTISTDDLDITLLGMVQTTYTSGSYIPSTHPLKIEGMLFEPVEDVIGEYANLKSETNSDLLILLSHLGTSTDISVAQNFPCMDLIIGGHSHAIVDEIVNNIPVYQCGSYLNQLGKITLKIKDKAIISEEFELIDLNSYPEYDAGMTTLIDDYNNVPAFDEIIGYNEYYLPKYSSLGCLYTDALRSALNTDISMQNGGGIRENLDEGDISVREVYAIDPFNNGARTYSMTVGMIKSFFEETGAGMHYSGIIIEDDGGGGIIIKSPGGDILADNTTLTLGLNDYIPAVYNEWFTGDPIIDDNTCAELIIDYIRNTGTISYSSCNNYFVISK